MDSWRTSTKTPHEPGVDQRCGWKHLIDERGQWKWTFWIELTVRLFTTGVGRKASHYGQHAEP